jgi:hypothetical protein
MVMKRKKGKGRWKERIKSGRLDVLLVLVFSSIILEAGIQ